MSACGLRPVLALFGSDFRKPLSDHGSDQRRSSSDIFPKRKNNLQVKNS
jgi:hypothetical protein